MKPFTIGVAASAISALLAGTGYVGAQQWMATAIGPISHGNVAGGGGITGFYTINQGGSVILQNGAPEPPPTGTLYHQVVDNYFDADGNRLDTKSYTHLVGYDCNRGLRRQDQDLVAQDDGHGHVQFAQSRLPSEPAVGVKPITAEGLVRARLAINNRSPATGTDGGVAEKDRRVDLAAK